MRSRGLVQAGDGQLEHVTTVSTMIYYMTFTLIGERLGIRSTYMNALGASSLLLALIINDFVLGEDGRLNLISYFIGQVRELLLLGRTSLPGFFLIWHETGHSCRRRH
jgi:hypothetical protein